MQLFWFICAVQGLIVLVLHFGDIGFDKPGRFGLAFEHYLISISLLMGLFVAAVIVIFRGKQWTYLGAQLLLLLLAAAGVANN